MKTALSEGRDLLVGCTGFVGGNLMASHKFSDICHSSDIHEKFDVPHDLVVYAGVPASMVLANTAPEKDLEIMKQARENFRRLKPRKAVLISSIAVYADSRGKDEKSEMEEKGLAPYGQNRLQLEQWVREDYPDALIVRLPALYGLGLKKNFLYDMITVTPAMLKTAKYEELSKKSSLVAESYTDMGNGFYKTKPDADKAALRAFFEANDFNALAFTDSRSRYQFYCLSDLWNHIQTALEHQITVLNLTTPPVSAAEVYRYVTGKDFLNELAGLPFDYDLRSRYSELLGGSNGYLCTIQQELESIKKFVDKGL